MGTVEDKLILDVADKFNDVLKEMSNSRNLVNEMLYDEVVALKGSINQLSADVASITNSVTKLAEVADALKEKVDDTEKIKDKGRLYIFAGKLLMIIGGSIASCFLFLKDNIYNIASWIKEWAK